MGVFSSSVAGLFVFCSTFVSFCLLLGLAGLVLFLWSFRKIVGMIHLLNISFLFNRVPPLNVMIETASPSCLLNALLWLDRILNSKDSLMFPNPSG